MEVTMHIVVGHTVIGRAVIARIVIGLVFLAALMLLTSRAAPAFVAAPAVAQSNGLVLQVRGGMGGGGGHHASRGRSNHNKNATQSTRPPGVGALGRTGRNVGSRNFATDGNVTNGPNVSASRDINDRRAAVVTNDGRVVVLNDRHAAVVNGMSGVLIRLHSD
jgi:hypothetical protein